MPRRVRVVEHLGQGGTDVHRVRDALPLDPLAERLDGYHLYHAARGELLRRRGLLDEARVADRRALELTENPAERRLLEERLGG